MKKKILVLKAGILNAENSRELKKAGYILIETDNPKDIIIFDEFGSLDNDSYLSCALQALDHGNDPTCRHAFGKLVKEGLLKKLNQNK